MQCTKSPESVLHSFHARPPPLSPPSSPLVSSLPLPHPSCLDQYISSTVGASALNVGEFWVDVAWSGSDLEFNQARPERAQRGVGVER
jgi:hypothetical protein